MQRLQLTCGTKAAATMGHCGTHIQQEQESKRGIAPERWNDRVYSWGVADGPEIFATSLFYRRSYGAFNGKIEGKVVRQEG